MRTLVWFRGKDLRVADHAPLRQAAASGEVIPLFVLDPYFFAPDRARELPHRMQFLLESLCALAASLEARGSRLLTVEGKSTEVVPRLAKKWRVDRVAGHRWTEPFARERDGRVRERLAADSIPFDLHEGETLLPPGRLRTGTGRPYTVFTPFARAFVETAAIEQPLAAPRKLPPLPAGVKTTAPVPTCKSLGITPNPRLLRGNERVWREFTHSTLWDRPELLARPFCEDFSGFPWPGDEGSWAAWARGETGYPVVDAAARQLLGEGFVHKVLRTAGVALGRTYPRPVVDHQWARGRFLALARDHLSRVPDPLPVTRRLGPRTP